MTDSLCLPAEFILLVSCRDQSKDFWRLQGSTAFKARQFVSMDNFWEYEAR